MTAPTGRPFAAVTVEIEGVPCLVVLPVDLPADPPEVVEGLRRRWLATLDGECPCGATRPPLPRQTGEQVARGETPEIALTFAHEADCPGGDAVLRRLLAAAAS